MGLLSLGRPYGRSFDVSIARKSWPVTRPSASGWSKAHAFLSGERVRPLSHLNVLFGDGSFRVRPPAHRDRVPADGDVGVVVGLVGGLRETVHERDRLAEVFEAKAALERPSHLVPSLGVGLSHGGAGCPSGESAAGFPFVVS